MSRRALIAVVALVALVAASGAAVVTARQGRAEAAAPAASPPLVGLTLQREAFDSSSLLGRPSVVNFFASWCPSCAEEAADLAAFAAAHPEIEVVGVAVRDRRADLRRFVAEHGLEFTVLMDENDLDARAWGVTGIPATFFLDAEGHTVTSIVGAATRAQLEDALESAR